MNKVILRESCIGDRGFCGHLASIDTRNIRNERVIVKIQVYNETDTLEIRLILKISKFEEFYMFVSKGGYIRVCGASPEYDIFEDKMLMTSVAYIEKMSN